MGTSGAKSSRLSSSSLFQINSIFTKDKWREKCVRMASIET
jgi:hypothetical protein